jgi:hypothetical protein
MTIFPICIIRGLYIIRERLQTALNVTDVRRIVHSTYIYRTILSL